MQTAEELFAHYRAVKARLSTGIRKEPVARPPKLMSPGERILLEVAEKHQVPVNEIRGHCRKHKIVFARRECAYRLKIELNLSLTTIGKFMNKDHTSILYAIREYEKSGPRGAAEVEVLGA